MVLCHVRRVPDGLARVPGSLLTPILGCLSGRIGAHAKLKRNFSERSLVLRSWFCALEGANDAGHSFRSCGIASAVSSCQPPYDAILIRRERE